MRNIAFLVAIFSITVVLISCGGGTDTDVTVKADNKMAVIAILEDMRSMDKGQLLDYLGDPDPNVRAAAARALGRINWPETAGSVAKLLDDSVETVRREAAFAIGQMRDTTAFLSLTMNLDDEKSNPVKAEMIKSLGKLGNLVAVAMIREYMDDPDPEIRGAVALALSRMRGHNRVQDLIELSRDSIEDVRWKAVFAMMQTGDSTSFGRLEWCLKDSNDLVRMFAAKSIGVLGDSTGMSDLTDRLRRERNNIVKLNIIQSISQIGDKRALKSLLNVLSEDNPDYVKAEAVRAIGILKLEKTVSRILPFAESDNPLLRGNTYKTLAVLDGIIFLKNAYPYLEGANWYDKMRILDALSEVKANGSRIIAGELFEDPDFRVRRTALHTLMQLSSPELRDYIDKALVDPDLSVQLSAIEIIASQRATVYSNKLVDVFDNATDKDKIRQAIVEILGSWYDSASVTPNVYNVFARALEDDNRRVKKAAVMAFLRLRENYTDRLKPFDTDITGENYDLIFNKYDSNPKAIIKTNRGDIVLELWYDTAPKTVNNFIKLANEGFYDENIWHRVIHGFVIQGGCPRGDGLGGPGYSIRGEYYWRPFERGTLGMASSGKDTEGSQFFICHTRLPHLDDAYTSFGKVLSGMRVVDRIEVTDSIRTIEIVEE